MKKRFLSILTALALCLTLLPGTALAEGPTEASTECPFTVKNGNNDATLGTDYTWETTITDDSDSITVNRLTIKTSGLTVSTKGNYTAENPASAVIVVENNVTTLTLAGVNITAPGIGGALNTTGGLTITLADGTSNTLKGGSGGNSCGIYAAGALEIKGDGTLHATGGAVNTSNSYSTGICSETSITIDGGTVEATGGTSTESGGTSFGIYANSSDNSPTITINGGNVTAKGGQAAATSCGMSATGAITITDGSVEATGGTATNNSYGIRSTQSTISITGGTGTATTTGSSATNKGAMNKAPSFTNVGSKQANTETTMNWGPVPSITTQPTAQTVTAGEAATFTVTAENASSYKWQSSTDNGANWTNVDGVTTASYTTGATTTAMNNTQYRCVVDNEYGSATSEAVTLTVNAAPVTQYTVTYNGNGADSGAVPVDSSNPYNSGATVTVLGAGSLAKTGYTFAGWNTAADGSGTNYAAGATFAINGNTTLYAQWTAETPTTYTVTFDGNGGGVSPATMETGTDGKLSSLPTASRSNYTFLGWFTAVSGGERITTDKVYTANTTVYAHWSYNGSSGGDWGGGSSGGSSSSDKETVKNPDGSTTTTEEKKDGTVIEKTERPDGSTTVIETKPDGSSTEETKRPDGSTTVIEKQPDGTTTTTDTDKEGNKTEVVEKPDGSMTTTVELTDGTVTITVVDPDGKVLAEVALTEKALEGKDTVEIPMPALPASNDRETAPTVTLGVPDGVTVKVEIPVEAPRPGTVAILVKEDGSEEIVRTSVATEDGVALTVEGITTVKIVDNSKDFVDVADTDWEADAVDFVSARELFNGTSATTFAPDLPMSRAMLAKVLHNLENNPDAGLNGIFPDVDNGAWYAEAVSWAADKGIVSGYPDGSFGANDSISREQLAVMLWRYAGSPEPRGSLGAFPDGGDASGYAVTALRWAVGEGIIGGTDQGILMPKASATRAQVAAMLMRFCENIE